MTLEFKNALVNFIEKHILSFDVQNFESAQTIHRLYVAFIEQTVSSKIKLRYGTDVIKVFYNNYSADFKTYEAIDMETAFIILELVSFKHFQSAMITRKSVSSSENAAMERN